MADTDYLTEAQGLALRDAVAAALSKRAHTPSPLKASDSKGVLWGAWINGNAYYGPGHFAMPPWDMLPQDQFESNVGKKASIIHYGNGPWWAEEFATSFADKVTARGSYVFIDQQCGASDLPAITAGTHDAAITAWAETVAAWGKPMFFRWNSEFNSRGLPAADFVAAWRHAKDLCDANGAVNVTWVWCPNQTTAGENLAPWYPGDSYVDWLAFDAYNWGSESGNAYLSWGDTHATFADTYDKVSALSSTKPIMVAETASNEAGGDKAAWITELFSAQIPVTFPRIKAVCWFEWPIFEMGRTQKWPIESSVAALGAFRRSVGENVRYLAGGRFGSAEGQGKILPPGDLPVMGEAQVFYDFPVRQSRWAHTTGATFGTEKITIDVPVSSTSYAFPRLVRKFDLTNAALEIRVDKFGTENTASELKLSVSQASNEAMLVVTGNSKIGYKAPGRTYVEAPGTVAAGTYFRMRFYGGILYWETSADRKSWRVVSQIAATWLRNSAQVFMAVGAWQGGAASSWIFSEVRVVANAT